MNKKVIEIVRKYVEEHLDKSDPKQEYDVYVVWQCYILSNAKWLLSTTLPDGMYYEITYNKIMDEDGRVGQLSRIVPYRSPSERFMCATLSLTLFFHMEKKDGTYDNREVYVHGFPIKL